MTGMQASAGPFHDGTRGTRVLLIDGDEAPRRALAGHLGSHLTDESGIAEVTEAVSVEDALSDAMREIGPEGPPPWDIAVASALDDADGRAQAASLRSVCPGLPVVLMVPGGGPSRGDWPAGVVSTNRPVRLGVLVTLLRNALTERIQATTLGAPGTGFTLGPYVCDPAGRTLVERASGQVLALTEKEAAILACLYDAPLPVSREALLAEVWGYADGVTTHTLETHIHRLRRKIEADPREPRLLVTDERGYSLGP
ncbi:response regulator transcription factor [Rhodospira trueperi]|uniref:DNA-binding response regulator, OmpR family, contains REC and winged-helix (WHTH) domain n=1 Tax=Rhodospira trueperi TaxID=69960 RepID=A0A1G6XCU2_9PROT|nr:response regulator transcription factor [Rhodospira trueperi]SDD76029.1 DNA-binding response regulator, OmpR family, contains REC and winged-helix (wHTH) domain [Rhodospira trueperi]